MVKMFSTGITIEVPDEEVYLYKRAGYSVVEDAPAAPVEETKPEDAPAAPEKKSVKK